MSADEEVHVCQQCEGSGWIHVPLASGTGTLTVLCQKCEGDGNVVHASFRVGTYRASSMIPARFWPGRRP